MTPVGLKIKSSESHSCVSRNPEKEISNGDLRCIIFLLYNNFF
ncbi:MAG: hypothetical protein ACYCTB_06000 [bacterium]